MKKYQARVRAASPSESGDQLVVFVEAFPRTSKIADLRFIGKTHEVCDLFAKVRGLDKAIDGPWHETINKLKDAVLEAEVADGKVTLRLLPDGEPVDVTKLEDPDATQKDQAAVLGTLDPSKQMPGEDDAQDKMASADNVKTPGSDGNSAPQTEEHREIK